MVGAHTKSCVEPLLKFSTVFFFFSFFSPDILVQSILSRLWMRTDVLSAPRMTRAYVFGNGECMHASVCGGEARYGRVRI